ncbi:hypothetical protein ASE27_00285 [Oerskovia sp. Root918]|uniref:hypothetical protein n=1 Tax=Oerskovia sp. Root918 TaxID=1736607 RepID=UPI0006FFD4EE|nr:hypothetical protein [Oerskovia sp. Root918]KRD46927.1 hypothetical protein ASE27_00285 [Oerskovia sp. Root918]
MTSNRPPSISPTARDDSAAPNDPADDLDEKPPGISVTQVVASALAAVSSTVLLSYLGVAGTIIGAGIASVLTIVGNNIYTRSILKTRRQMKAALQAGVVLPVGKNGRKVLLPTLAGSHGQGAGGSDGSAGGPGEGTDATGSGTAVLPAVGDTARLGDTAVLGPDDLEGTHLDDLRTAAGAQAGDRPDGATDLPDDGDASGDGAAGDDTADSRRPSRRTLILSTVAVFVVLLVGVTLVEVVAGRPLSEILRGEEGSGTTISHVVSREPASTGDTGDTTGGTTDPSTDAPSSGTTPSPAPSESVPAPAPTDPPTTVPDPEPTTPVTPAPDPTPGTGGDTGGSGAGSGSGGTDLEQLPGTGTGSGTGSGTGAEGAPGTGTSGSATS